MDPWGADFAGVLAQVDEGRFAAALDAVHAWQDSDWSDFERVISLLPAESDSPHQDARWWCAWAHHS